MLTLPIDAPRDVPWASLPAMVRASAALAPDAEVAVDPDVRVTGAELLDDMTAIGRAAMALGLEPGDTVALWAPNSAQWVRAACGLLAAGATVVLMSTRFKGNEAAHAVRASDAKAIFTVGDFLGVDFAAMLHEAAPELAAVPVVLLDDTEAGGRRSWRQFLAAGDAVPTTELERREAALTPEDVAFVLFTSGTTGRPKGAMQRHRGIMFTAVQLRDGFGLEAGDRMFVVLPFFHVFGLAVVFAGLVTRATTVTVAGAFDPEGMVATLDRERITFVPGPPPVFDAILAAPNRTSADLSRLRVCFVASTGIPGPLVRRLKDERVFASVTTGYGLTEGLIVSLSRLDEDVETTASWSGQILPEAEVRVLDDAGRPVVPGEPGELVVRTPSTTAGYYRDPDATAAALDDDGWLRTGDVGIVDERGYVRITDRKKDMYIVGGFNAYPAEIETILREHPDVGQVAVVGVPDERLGEVGVAFVVPEAGRALDAAALTDWAGRNMANYKVPRRVVIRDALPMTASMKVAKFELRSELAHAPGGPPNTASEEAR